MSIKLTLNRIPLSGELKDECGLPFASVVQPFAGVMETSLDRPCESKAASVARCTSCYSYINKHCAFDRAGWTCCMCHAFNEYTDAIHEKYKYSQGRFLLPELRRSIVELECDANEGLKFDDEDDSDEDEAAAAKGPVYGTPMYVALVDVCGSDDYLELVKSALQAALEAMPAGALFGLVTFSNQIGLYEVGDSIPRVSHVPILEEDGAPTPLDLEDALPLTSLLASVAEQKDAIAAAIDTLQAQPFELSPGSVSEALEGHCGFGSAIQVVLRYLGGAASSREMAARMGDSATASASGPAQNGKQGLGANAYTGGRLLTFLGGPPNYGRGAVFRAYVEPAGGSLGPSASEIMMDPMMADLNPYTFSMPAVAGSQTQVAQDQIVLAGADQIKVVIDDDSREFYEEAAAAAASLAICIDLYVVSPTAVGLRCLEPLAVSSGGAVYLYPSLEEAALPQDLYRRLSAPQALGGLLRMRTSADFKVARAFGHLYPDDQFDNLFHIISCDPQDAFVFDFEYTKSSGLEVYKGVSPMLQMIFQYSVLLPTHSSSGWGAQGDALLQPFQRRFTLQRRMRVITMPVNVGSNPREVFANVDPDVVLTVLLHKIVATAAAEGASEGHALLQSWLAQLFAQYNLHVLGASSSPGVQPDVTFEAVEALQPMARLVYGLLRSPVLTQAAKHHPDLHTALRLLWTGLPPSELRRAVYPLLSSYTTPDEQAYPRHSLSEAALATSGAPIFLLDSFTQVLVYYVAGCPVDLPFPPPQQSALRVAVNKLRADRRLTPQLRMLRGGVDDVRSFHDCLIEEPDSGLAAAGAAAGQGFALFLESVRAEVVRCLQRVE